MAVALAALAILIAGSAAIVPQLARAQPLTPESAPFAVEPQAPAALRRWQRTVQPPVTPVALDVAPTAAAAAPARVAVRARRGVDWSEEESAPRITSAAPVAAEPSPVTEVLAVAPT